ncbi:MAG: LacI family DNA-binding transcriptional regulator [Anaerolineaceae bacterium]|nr:LacI family DNA-binding transcriptional regulator [Anaerolineaceae bacterium]
MSVTVIDVAKEAGVSRTTVSNVFSGRAKFSEETRVAVLAAAKKLGYKPNLAARSLITNKSRLIGLILPSYLDTNTLTNSPFYNIIIDGIYAILREEPFYDLMLFTIPRRESLTKASEWIDIRNVDGILAIGEYEPSFLADLNSKDIPIVLIDNYAHNRYQNFAHILSDDETGAFTATQFLIERGYKHIALCSSAMYSPLMQKRALGYKRALDSVGYTEQIFSGGDMAYESGLQFADELIKQNMDAAFCSEDMLAIGLLHALLANGVKVGSEFGLIGFDNINFSKQVYPELTTIDQNIFAKGQTAAKTLLSILKGEEVNLHQVLPVELVIRNTT